LQERAGGLQQIEGDEALGGQRPQDGDFAPHSRACSRLGSVLAWRA
jgi:hypothetical protein